MLRLLALACCALIAVPASAQTGEGSTADKIFAAVDQVCLPILRREVDATDPANFDAFLTQRGFKMGISRAQVDLFPPPADSTLSRAFLVSGESEAHQLVMAIGGVEESCRLFVIGAPGDRATAYRDVAARFAQSSTWERATPPPTASPRMAFVQGGQEQPTALTLVFPQSELTGIVFNAIAFAR